MTGQAQVIARAYVSSPDGATVEEPIRLFARKRSDQVWHPVADLETDDDQDRTDNGFAPQVDVLVRPEWDRLAVAADNVTGGTVSVDVEFSS